MQGSNWSLEMLPSTEAVLTAMFSAQLSRRFQSLPIHSLQECELCHCGDDQYCPKAVMTYNSSDWTHGDAPTHGGYSNRYVLHHQ